MTQNNVSTGRIIRDNPNNSKLPIIGKIKIGVKTETACKSLDYFIADGKYAALFDKAYGEKPNKIQILFLSDDIREVCNERYELRTDSGRLFGDGDGFTFRVWSEAKKDYQSFNLSEHPDLLVRAEKASKSPKGWQNILTIRFMLPAITGVFGQWQLSTKGKASSINAIRDTFDFVQDKAGTVTRIPFDIIVEKVKSQKPDDKSLYPVITLIPNMSDENLSLVSRLIESGMDWKKIPMFTNELIESKKPQLLEANIEEAEVIKENTKESPIAGKSNKELGLPFEDK